MKLLTHKTLKPGQTLIIDGKEYSYQWLVESLLTEHPKAKRPASIRKVFECGGVNYFTCAPEDLPAKRYQEFTVRFEEMRMACNREYLLHYVDAAKNLLGGTKGEINLVDFHTLVWDLEQRLNLAPLEDHIYKIASVLYFDLNEELSTYNFEYNNEKIAKWKAHDGPPGFFFDKPMRDLCGLGKLSTGDLATFLKEGKIKETLLRATSEPLYRKYSTG